MRVDGHGDGAAAGQHRAHGVGRVGDRRVQDGVARRGRAGAATPGMPATSSLVPTHAPTERRRTETPSGGAPRRRRGAERRRSHRRRIRRARPPTAPARRRTAAGGGSDGVADRQVDDPARERPRPCHGAGRAGRRGRAAASSRVTTTRTNSPEAGRVGLVEAGADAGGVVLVGLDRAPRPSRCRAASTSPRSYGTRSSTTRLSDAQPVGDRDEQLVDAVAGHGREMTTEPGSRPLRRLGAGRTCCRRPALGDVAGADLARAPRGRRRSAPSGSGADPSTTCTSRSARRHLVERRAEGLHQLVRQLADEADGVGEQHDLAAGEGEAPRASDRASRTAGPRPARRPSVSRLSSVDLPALV